ncbi:FGGY-family carbohydrate kinase [Spirosoma sp. KUDC1026]|uniref:FGGY-family carbohydrate kinase n=1 Tax=Spirosoma sp. KUDC1026 TaxID=2745947 RepID=UPI00159B95DC|nr:FGGY family carbohydrate kinase [Spirosoma sp. KUDC1026]QKZ15254.1 carbohydrate kinase [Spirosoma sp. KUDC1026]
MPFTVIAVIDVGKTNKKLFLFDQLYRIVWEKSQQLPERVDEDGDPCEDVDELTRWVKDAVDEVLALPQFAVQALNFSTYGASFVYLDADRKLVGQLYNYLKPFPESLRRQFVEQYDPAGELALQTASPLMDSLNSGLMLYRIRHDKPQLFRQIRHALHLPQYLSHLFTDEVVSDVTSIGCHTLLWNFSRQQYHDWVVAEGLDRLFGQLYPADQVVGTIAGTQVHVGGGLHDSSAALIPYLASFQEPFLLISTGTWCISLNPFNAEPLTANELQNDCLCYLQYKGQPVKASRLFAGYEHEQQMKRLAVHFGVAPDYYKQVRYNEALVEQLRQAEPGRQQTKAGVILDSGFGERELGLFPDYETAYHQFMIDLVAAQVASTDLVLTDRSVPLSRIYVDGGFSHNPLYMNLLAAAFPQHAVWAASVAQATALGAALAIHNEWNPMPVPADLITLRQYTRTPSLPVQTSV